MHRHNRFGPGCRPPRVPRAAWTAAAFSLSILLVCLLFCGCRSLSKPGPVPQSVATCRQLTQQGASAMERSDWNRAESMLARAVQANVIDADARRNYAEALWHRGALEDALAQFEEARRLAGEDASLTVRTGEAHLALGHADAANRLAHDALRMDPKFASGWALRGQVALATGLTRQALADLQRSLGYAPENGEVAILVAEAYRGLNQPEQALLTLQSLADGYSPGEEPQRLLYLQGLALVALSRYDEAVVSLSQAAHRDRATSEILCRLAEAELLSGKLAAAQKTIQQALVLDPNHAGSQILSGRLAAAVADAKIIRR